MSQAIRHILQIPGNMLLFQEGDPGAEAFIIVRGEIEIFTMRDDRPVVLAKLGPGEIVGEMAIIDAAPRSASARTLTDCALVQVSAEQFSERLKHADPVLRMCLNVILDRHRGMIRRLREQEPNPRQDQNRVQGRAIGPATETLIMERELQAAISGNELVAFFQPLIALGDMRLVGFEMLLRWQHPTRGLLRPDAFVGVAEASGLICDLTSWGLEAAGRSYADLSLAALRNVAHAALPMLHVNVSGIDLQRSDFMWRLKRALRGCQAPPSQLCLEVTESVLMTDPERARGTLEACRHEGIGVAIDDFGMGYSSLSYLGRLPITSLKIDQSFVQSQVSDATSAKIVQLILALSRELDLDVVAEGIETQAQYEAIAAKGCAFGQGYLFGRPMPLDQAVAFTAQWRSRAPWQAGHAWDIATEETDCRKRAV
jgi:EAL domain-containing protein (putative c-di-GMP-specific phosphodiesterase class I)